MNSSKNKPNSKKMWLFNLCQMHTSSSSKKNMTIKEAT